MTTLAQLVDLMIRETSRYDLRGDIARYANQTIRELCARPDTGAPISYPSNRVEAQLTASSSTGFSWDIPNPSTFQTMEAVRYDSLVDKWGRPLFAQRMGPSDRQMEIQTFYYRSGTQYSFAGYGGLNATISLSWFEYPRSLKDYVDPLTRPAEYDAETGWTYPLGASGSVAQAAARGLVSNWLFMRWPETVAEGLRAKTYKRLSDDSRGRTSYSLYQDMRRQLVGSEAFESGG